MLASCFQTYPFAPLLKAATIAPVSFDRCWTSAALSFLTVTITPQHDFRLCGYWLTPPAHNRTHDLKLHLKREGSKMRNAVVQILVVDDYEPFRRFLHLKLQSRPELQIVGEASDGLQAVQKAE